MGPEPDKKLKKTRPYEKPRLRIIELAAEEVLAIGCKTSSSSALLAPTCTANRCVGLGS